MTDTDTTCEACGDASCNKDVAWVEDFAVHADEHPENVRERRMDNRPGWL